MIYLRADYSSWYDNLFFRHKVTWRRRHKSLKCFAVSPVIIRSLNPKPVGGDLHWVAMTTNDKLPPGAVIGGVEKGEVVYIARAMYANSVRPGKYVPSLQHAYLCFMHEVRKKDTFEVRTCFIL